MTPDKLEKLAWSYITECINHKRPQATASGKIVYLPDRHLPTISYFLKIWIPMQGEPTICRQTFYNWLQSKDTQTMDTIKNIEGYFNALAIDIVANEGKGVFYAKNKLGMTDRIDTPVTLDPINCYKIENNSFEIINRPQILIAKIEEIAQTINKNALIRQPENGEN